MKKLSILTVITLILCACNTPPRAVPDVFAPDLRSPNVQIGEVEMQFNRTFPMPGIRKLNVSVYYFPAEDAVCLQWRMDMTSYYQFWSYDGREEFTAALEKYKEDYEARNFGRSSRATKRKYGAAEGYIIWQMASFTIQAKTANAVNFGYYFVDRAPYFVVNQRETTYEDPLTRDNNKTIPEMPIYFTRAQADELAALFNPAFLENISVAAPGRRINVDVDEY